MKPLNIKHYADTENHSHPRSLFIQTYYLETYNRVNIDPEKMGQFFNLVGIRPTLTLDKLK